MNPTRATPDKQFWFHASHWAGPFQITHKSYSSAFSQGWHEHDRGCIDFVLVGSGTGTYGKDELISVGGQVEYCAAEVRHRFNSGPTGIRTMHIAFPADLPGAIGIDPGLMASSLPFAGALGPATAILEEILGTPRPDLLLLESLAMRILEDLAGPSGDDGGRCAWIEEVRSLLIDSPELATSLRDIASIVGRHPSHVSRTFRSAFGLSVGEFGRRVRLTRSAQSLASGKGGSIARVALDHGFCDQAHYANAFRRFVGCSPRQFVRRLGRTPGSDPAPPAWQSP